MKRITFNFLVTLTFPIWVIACLWHFIFEEMDEWHTRISEEVRKEENKNEN